MLPAMSSRLLRSLQGLELEERILNIGTLMGAVGVALPWISGDWQGGDQLTYTGFGFFTSLNGVVIFLLHFAVLLLTIIPLFGGPVIIRRKRLREIVRLCLTTQAVVLTLAALSVLLRVTIEFTRMEVRFGIYVCLVGGLIGLFESIVRFVEYKKAHEQETFHHPEDILPKEEEGTFTPPPPPPPPPRPPEPEEHRLYP